MTRINVGFDNTKLKGDVLYPELSFQIMQVMFDVHNCLGPGFSEDIYEKAVCLEFSARGIPYEEQKPYQIYFKGQLVGTYRLDLIVDNKIILELKAVSALQDIHKQQVISYLKATGLHLGIVINFGSNRVQKERLVN
ncbi:MAG TPA: GxxExxY protein [Armatimonadota bacterium]|jgi:GxxExxY protein